MQRVLEPEPVTCRVRISPALALLHILPLLDLAARFPGVDPWLPRLSSRLGREARSDIRLITVPLSGAVSIFLRTPDTPESCEAGLAALAAAPAGEVHRMVLEGLARDAGLDGAETAARLLRDDPAGFRDILKTLELPTRDEAYPIDWDRALRLLHRPEELKALLVNRLGSLWHDHMAEAWRQRLGMLQRAADQARRHLGRGAVDAVFRAVTGRDLRAELRAQAAKAGRLVFCPNPFLGPYISLVGDEIGPDGEPALWVGYGVTAVSAAGDGDPALPGGLPAALGALADESRLRVLALTADRGEVTAAEIMSAFGWTQPTTSRQLRQLVSTGWLIERREDRIKRYRVDPSRVDQLADGLRRLLKGSGW
ncbi:MAG TPA: metalloregulator ArsR/SmtB family transcription factor [Bacillota bacterium]